MPATPSEENGKDPGGLGEDCGQAGGTRSGKAMSCIKIPTRARFIGFFRKTCKTDSNNERF